MMMTLSSEPACNISTHLMSGKAASDLKLNVNSEDRIDGVDRFVVHTYIHSLLDLYLLCQSKEDGDMPLLDEMERNICFNILFYLYECLRRDQKFVNDQLSQPTTFEKAKNFFKNLIAPEKRKTLNEIPNVVLAPSILSASRVVSYSSSQVNVEELSEVVLVKKLKAECGSLIGARKKREVYNPEENARWKDIYTLLNADLDHVENGASLYVEEVFPKITTPYIN